MKDLLKDEDGDLLIKNNDLSVGISDKQHQYDLLLSDKGSIKQFPEAGVGAYKYLEGEDPAALLQEIALQFTADGMDVESIKFLPDGNLELKAAYK